MERWLFENPIFAIILYLVFSIADYYLTIVGARYYRQNRTRIEYETGYELNPRYQTDINKLNLFSPRFVQTSVIILITLSLAFFFIRDFYVSMFIYGLILLPSLIVDLHHLSNIWTFKSIHSRKNQAYVGRIKIKTWATYKQSAYVAFFQAALLLLLVSIFNGSPMFLGGAVGELNISRWFSRLGNNALKTKKELKEEAARKKREKPVRPGAANLLMFAILALVLLQLLRIAFLIQYSFYSIALEPFPQKITGLMSATLAIFTGLWLIRAIGLSKGFSLIAARRIIPLFLGLSWLAVLTMPGVYYSFCLSTVLVVTLIIIIWGFAAFEGLSAKKYYKLEG
jgi:hypothetical protein